MPEVTRTSSLEMPSKKPYSYACTTFSAQKHIFLSAVFVSDTCSASISTREREKGVVLSSNMLTAVTLVFGSLSKCAALSFLQDSKNIVQEILVVSLVGFQLPHLDTHQSCSAVLISLQLSFISLSIFCTIGHLIFHYFLSFSSG